MGEKLAIFGGIPVRSEKIYYGHQYIDDEDIMAVVETLRAPLITQGPRIDGLEKDLCQLTGAKYAVAVANGTVALHLCCMAAGIKEGDQVITTPLTFAASANCILYCGGTPVFADVNPETYNIDPDKIEERINEHTKAVVAVDFTGQAVELDRIRAICKKHNLLLIEDAAHSIGTNYNGISVGNLADMTTFSFHPVKTVTGGEGGAIVTNNEELYKKICLYRSHGITREPSLMSAKSEGGWYYEQVGLGNNYRMTDMQAALISSQLKKLPAFVARRKEIVERYNEAFQDVDGIVLQKEIPESDTARHLYLLQLELEKLTVGRKYIYEALAAENVQPNVHYIPVYYHPYYQKLGYKKGLCPEAERLYDRILTIPLYYSMTDQDVEDVIAAVKKVILYCRK